MTSVTALIVDNDFQAAKHLKKSLLLLGYQTIEIVDNSAEALEIIFAESPNLVILDVEIKGKLNSIQLGKRLQSYDIPILFTTSATHPKYYQFSQQAHPTTLLAKPYNTATLASAIKSTLNHPNSDAPISSSDNNDSIFIKHNNSLKRVPLTQINFIQSEGNYSLVYTKERKYAIKISLRRIQNELPKNVFIQIHQRYVVPIDKISNIELSSAKVVVGENTFPLGRTYKADLLEHFHYLK
ncbi:MAG: LytR/AlgR family response regulator transcription factor [Saprospiraceae bacterium]